MFLPLYLATKLSEWWSRVTGRLAAAVVGWAFKHHEAQEAFLEQVRCRRNAPINEELRDFIDGRIGRLEMSVNVDDISGFEGAVEQEIESYFRHNNPLDPETLEKALEDIEIDAEQVKGLEDEISKKVAEYLDESDDYLVRAIAQRMSY